MQEPAFMFIQYSYAVVTMLPCPLWFYHLKLSSIFISFVALMSVYNGATYYSAPHSLHTTIPVLTAHS